MDNLEYVITLVHGTFAKDAPWVRPDSGFARGLGAQIKGKVTFKTFDWSGINTHQVRHAEATRLATQLDEQLRFSPNCRHLVVAHSHGGNIALYAQDDLRIRGRVSGIVTLGTPFIECKPRETGFAEVCGIAYVLIVGGVLGAIGLALAYLLVVTRQ